jgi:hypothetical protein
MLGNLVGWDASKVSLFRTSRAGMRLLGTLLAGIVSLAGIV